MKRRQIPLLFFLSFAIVGCNNCLICTAEQDGELVEREVCGSKQSRTPLINALESDTSGVGPWTCSK